MDEMNGLITKTGQKAPLWFCEHPLLFAKWNCNWTLTFVNKILTLYEFSENSAYK